MIEIKNLKKRFGEKEILKGVDLQIRDGVTTVIFGLSGSGKSTIIKHIVGLLKPDSGNIYVDDFDVTNATEKELLGIRKRDRFFISKRRFV